MANHWPDILADFEHAITTAWPDSTRWDLEANIEKVDWEEETRGSTPYRVSPFTVVEAGAFPEWQAGSSSIWHAGDVTFYYVSADDADIVTTLQQKITDMQAQLAGRWDGEVMQVIPGGWVQDWGPGNRMNMKLFDQKLDYTAGALTCRIVVPGALI